MTRRVLLLGAVLTAMAALAVERRGSAQSGLAISYGEAGLERLSYGGVVLEDQARFPADAFHIWHMKVTDLNGAVLSSPQDTWGENNSGRQWDAGSHTWTYRYPWGSIALQYQQAGNTLNLHVTETNLAGSGVILAGATLYPLALHFPSLPSGFGNASYPQLAYNTTAPSVTVADFGKGLVAAVVPDASKPLYSGFLPVSGQANAYTALVSSTSPDQLASFQPHRDRPVAPGQTDQFTVSLRFAPSGTTTRTLAADAYTSWASTWPAQLHWTDRRIIGTAYLASSPAGDPSQPGGFPNNPRRYFNDAQPADFDVTNPAGLAKFQARVLAQAAATVANLQRLKAQGVITWDIEGEQYPQETSYVCSPDQIATVAPEMESTITDPASRYLGMKLDDAYFRTLHDAGFRVGVCVRPQHFTPGPGGTATQVTLPDAEVAAELIRKMTYAHDRWGATLFYLDSTVETNGAVLDASIFQQAAAALPDSLLIPEESTPKFYAYTAPFQTFLFHGDTGTDASIYSIYPHAFSANLINDVDAGKLADASAALTESVRRGDVLMVHADYWQANNDTVVGIYDAAAAGSNTAGRGSGTASSPGSGATGSADTTGGGASGTTGGGASGTTGGSSSEANGSSEAPGGGTAASAPGTPPPPVAATGGTAPAGAVAITSPISGSTLTGLVAVTAQIGVTLDAAGSYLMVDGQQIGTRRVVDGPYQYALDTTTLSNGQHTLQLWAHSTANQVVLSAAVPLLVSNIAGAAEPPLTTSSAAAGSSQGPAPAAAQGPSATTGGGAAANAATSPVVLTYPLSGQAISGVVAVAATITRTLDAAGSYLVVDGAEVGWQRVGAAPFIYQLDTSSLSAGVHSLQIWAHDTANETLLSAAASIMVIR